MPKINTLDEKRLVEIAKEANELYSQGNQNLFQLGKILVEAKEKLGRSRNWGAWVEENCIFSKAKDRYVRRVFTRFKNHEALVGEFSDTMLTVLSKRGFPQKGVDVIFKHPEEFKKRGMGEKVKKFYLSLRNETDQLVDALKRTAAGEEVTLPPKSTDPQALKGEITCKLRRLKSLSLAVYDELLQKVFSESGKKKETLREQDKEVQKQPGTNTSHRKVA